MRQDQYDKLQKLEEELTDVFLQEADPKLWPGVGATPANMDAQTRGDRYWCKKNAVATIAMMTRIGHLTGMIQRAAAGTEPDPEDGKAEDSLDAEVTSAEKEAKKLLAELQDPKHKAKFDKRVHGKG